MECSMHIIVSRVQNRCLATGIQIGLCLSHIASVLQVSLPASGVDDFQLQLSGTGIANLALSPKALVVNADTNGSFVADRQLDQVVPICHCLLPS